MDEAEGRGEGCFRGGRGREGGDRRSGGINACWCMQENGGETRLCGRKGKGMKAGQYSANSSRRMKEMRVWEIVCTK